MSNDKKPTYQDLVLMELRKQTALLTRISQALAPQRGSSSEKAIADDRDLDDKYGDPVIKLDPKKWNGKSMKGLRLSEVPKEAVAKGYLSAWAEMCDYFADKDEAAGKVTDKGKPVAEFKRKDAARARGWERRILDGRTPEPAAASDDDWGGGSQTAPPADKDIKW